MRAVAEFTKIPPERFASYVFTGQDYYRDPEAKVDVAALQKNIDVQHELGFLKSRVDVQRHVDLSLIEDAAKRVK